MAKISDMNGNKNSNYQHLFGNKKAGFLMSQAQAAMIRSGIEMEKYINGLIPKDRLTNIQSLRMRMVSHNKEFVLKPKKPKSGTKKGIVSDYAIVDHQKQFCAIVELKLGTAFDTQKSQQNERKFTRYV